MHWTAERPVTSDREFFRFFLDVENSFAKDSWKVSDQHRREDCRCHDHRRPNQPKWSSKSFRCSGVTGRRPFVRSTIAFRRPIRTEWLFFPLWLPCTGIVFFLAAYMLPPLIRRWSRKRKGLCRECGYDLTGNLSGVCSECATPTLSQTNSSRVTKTPDEDG